MQNRLPDLRYPKSDVRELYESVAYTAVMLTRNVWVAAGSLIAVMACAATAVARQESEALYACSGTAVAEASDIGATLCDAKPTETLTERIDIDNLQLRSGALVTEVVADRVGQVAGLRPGDVIYRVGGVDVIGAEEATERIALIERASDTVINFLRRGRPYRVKIRRP